MQVADRWHLWHNLAEAVEKTVAMHRAALREPEPATADEDNDTDGDASSGGQAALADTAPAEKGLVTRTREGYAAVQELLAGGVTTSAICRQLSLTRKTVPRYARAGHVEELLGKARSRGRLLDRFKPCLHERFNAGCSDVAQLTKEIADLGYRGSDKTVRRCCIPSAPCWSPDRRHRSRPPFGG